MLAHTLIYYSVRNLFLGNYANVYVTYVAKSILRPIELFIALFDHRNEEQLANVINLSA